MKKKYIAASLAALCAAGGAMTVHAEDMPVYTLDQVVVTANREPEKVIDSNADISVVTAKDIEANHYKSVADAVKQVPGVVIATRGSSSQTYFSDPITINGSTNVVVMVDGMRVNTNGLMGTHSQLGILTNMDSVDHIEVLKGSASTLYGSDAAGGVINIITKKPTDGEVHTTLDLSRASFDGEKYGLYNEGNKDGFFWTIEANKQIQGNFKDGWGRHVINHLNAESFAGKIGYDLGNDSSVTLSYEKYNADYTRPDYGSNDPTKDFGKKDSDRIALQYNARINDRLTNRLSMYQNRYHLQDDYNNAGSSGTTDLRLKTRGISDQLTYTMEGQTIIGGFDLYQDSVPYYAEVAGMQGKHATNLGFYVQDKWDINDRWNVTPGVRVEHNTDYGTRTTPSLTVGYKISDNTNYYASYKKFFNAPSLMQIYYDNYHTIPNPDLDPEEGYTVELGANHIFDDTLSGNIIVYRQFAKNLISWGYSSKGTQYLNTGKTINTGVNMSLTKKFSDHLSGTLGYSYFDGDIRNDSRVYMPKHELNVGLNYTDKKFDAYINGRGVMDRYTSTKSSYGVSESKTMKDYSSFWVWDIGADYKITKEATIYARVNNVFDQFYTNIGSSSPSYGPSGTWFAAPGRNYEVGMQYRF